MPQPLQILMLEDDETDVELIIRILRRSGLEYNHTVVGDRQTFERAVRDNHYDIILADNSVPKFNSMAALDFAKSVNGKTPFILVTGAVSEVFAVDILQKGADDYILKDNLHHLPAAIERALQKKRVILEKEKAEDELKKSEMRFRALIENNADAIVIRDTNFNLIYASPAAKKILGLDIAGETRKDPRDTIHPEDQEKLLQVQQEVSLNPGKPIPVEFRRLNDNGEFVCIEGVVTNMTYNEAVKGIVSNFRDISDRRRAENELKEANIALHNLSNHLQHIREEERIQIARDIHDELGQQLTGLKMDASWLNKKLVTEDKAIHDKLTDMIKLIDEAVKSVRRISSDLRPSMLDDLGLVAALEWHSHETEIRYGIPVKFHADCNDAEISVEKATSLFRIFQEALNNAIKHANAKSIISRLTKQDGRFILQINDDGVGMKEDEVKSKKTLGLLGIQERVFILSGKYTMKSEPGKGTFLQIEIPL
jgi:two-component system sensor histidine kinase UhpB